MGFDLFLGGDFLVGEFFFFGFVFSIDLGINGGLVIVGLNLFVFSFFSVLVSVVGEEFVFFFR